MASMERQSLDGAAETRKFDKGHMEVVTVGGHVVGRATFEPGWKWSESVKPIAGTDSCMVEHVGYIVSGQLKVVMDDGSETDARPGDAFYLAPGHDAWVVGNEPVVALDFQGATDYAKKG